ncbi:MAG: hypothetical protein JO339_22455 [Alphaproteobacteria bacterium]|nr:hypothetical protein [Alphaproteobacteria bacterium]
MVDSIPSGARPIPGTDYQISGNTIYRPDGQSVSKEEALREIGQVKLPPASLTIMQEVFGPDFNRSTLPPDGESRVPTESLAATLASKEQTLVADLKTVLLLLHEMTKDQRSTTALIRDADFEMQINSLKKAAEEGLAAAKTRMITGIVVGSVTALMGGVSIGGGARSMTNISAAQQAKTAGTMTNKVFDGALAKATALNQTTQAVGQTGQSLGQIGGAAGEYAAAGSDKAAKDADAQSKKEEQAVALMRDLIDAQREMLSSVRETLREIQRTEAETGKAVARV